MYRIHLHVRPNGRRPFIEYLENLQRSGSLKDADKISATVDDLSAHGSQRLARLRKAEKMNGVWQLRCGAHRVFYFWDRTRRAYVVLSAFRKRTARTPRAEIQRAERLMREYYGSIT